MSAKPGRRMRSKSIHTSAPLMHERDAAEEFSDDEEEYHSLNQSKVSENEWSITDEFQLVERLKNQSVYTDRIKYSTRMKQIDWNEIAFKNYSGPQCLDQFKKLIKHARLVRNLHEVVIDIESHLKKVPLKRPLNCYQLYVKDKFSDSNISDLSKKMKTIGANFKLLSEKERKKYDKKASTLKEEYFEKRKALLLENPILAASDKYQSPIDLFVASVKKDQKKEQLSRAEWRAMYNELSQEDKYNWIVRAVENSPGVDAAKFLTKDEQKMLALKGKKRAPTSYALFIKENYHLYKNKYETQGKAISAMAAHWQTLDEEEKEKYKIKAKSLKQEFQNESTVKKKKKKRNVSGMDESTIGADITDSILLSPKKSNSAPSSPRKGLTLGSCNLSVIPKESPKKSKKRQNEDDTNERPPTKLKKVSSTDDDGFVSPAPAETPLKKKKKKKDKSKDESLPDENNRSRTESESSSTQMTSLKKKKKKDKKGDSQDAPDESESSASAVTATPTKKKKKKDKTKDSEAVKPPQKPPSSLLKYFAENVYVGKPRKMERAFEKLSKKERKQLNVEYNEKVENYVTQLRTFLSSLPKEQAVAFITKIKAEEQEQGENNQQNGQNESSDD